MSEVLTVLALLFQSEVAPPPAAPPPAAPQSISPLTALWVAAIAALLGSFFTFIGGVVNDYFANKREDRRQKREEDNRQSDKEREDRIRKEQQDREDKLRVETGRLRAYQRFVDAATLTPYVPSLRKPDARTELNKSYVETQLFASDYVSTEARELYQQADMAIEASQESASSHWSSVDNAMKAFLEAARDELELGK